MTVTQVYAALAPFGILLLLYRAQCVEHDETCKKDPEALRWARRTAFWMTAFALGNSAHDAMSPLSMLILVLCACSILGVDVLVSRFRRRPPGRDTDTAPVYRAPARVRRPF